MIGLEDMYLNKVCNIIQNLLDAYLILHDTGDTLNNYPQATEERTPLYQESYTVDIRNISCLKYK